MMPDPSWLAGYRAGLHAPNETCAAIAPPDDYTDSQCSSFVSGRLIGARDQRNNALLEELQRGFE